MAASSTTAGAAVDHPPRPVRPRPPIARVRPDDRVEMREEAFTMALYVAICLLAALAACPDDGGGPCFEFVWAPQLAWRSRTRSHSVSRHGWSLQAPSDVTTRWQRSRNSAVAVALLATVPASGFP